MTGISLGWDKIMAAAYGWRSRGYLIYFKPRLPETAFAAKALASIILSLKTDRPGRLGIEILR